MFCFSYAGGSAQIFKTWGDILPAEIEVCAIQLPGRAGRFREPRYTSVSTAVSALTGEIEHLANKPFALYGHSLGAAMAFEMGLSLEKRGRGPRLVAASGMMSPTNPSKEPAIYHLPDAQFRQKVKEFDGTPKEILEHEELMDLMMPLLKADFTMADTYVYQPGRILSCPLHVHAGTEDPHTDEEGLLDWKNFTSAGFSQKTFQGDHFFVNSLTKPVLEDLAQKLTSLR